MSQVTHMNYYVPARKHDRVSGRTQFHYHASAPGCQSVFVWMSKETYTAIYLCQSSSTVQCNCRDTVHTCNTLQHTATHLNIVQCNYCTSAPECPSVCLRKYVCLWRSICVSMTMGWLRAVGSLKSYVFSAKEPYKRDNILQKRPIILRSLRIVATP